MGSMNSFVPIRRPVRGFWQEPQSHSLRVPQVCKRPGRMAETRDGVVSWDFVNCLRQNGNLWWRKL